MKKGLIIGFIALATTLAVYAGVENQNAKSECCNKSICCPIGTEVEKCCDKGCE